MDSLVVLKHLNASNVGGFKGMFFGKYLSTFKKNNNKSLINIPF